MEPTYGENHIPLVIFLLIYFELIGGDFASPPWFSGGNAMKFSYSSPMTTLELCEFLKASKRTIEQYNREGMPRFFVGKECRYLPEKVVAWLERRAFPRIGTLSETMDPKIFLTSQ